MIQNQRQDLSDSLSVAYQSGGLSTAISLCHQRILQNPHFSDAYDFLGDFLWIQHKHKAAIRAYAHAVSIEPNRTCFQVRKDQASQLFANISDDRSSNTINDEISYWIGDTLVCFSFIY